MEKKTQIFAYLSIPLGFSKPQVIEKYGTYANWIKTTNQYNATYKIYKEICENINDVTNEYDIDTPIYDSNGIKENLLIDIYFGHSDRRAKLLSLIEYAKQNNNQNQIVLCVYDMTLLGSTRKMIRENYFSLLSAKIAVYFINIENSYNIMLRTTDESLSPLSNDFNSEYFIKQFELHDISPRSLNWTGQNFKKEITDSFIDAYFLYQLFLIGDEEALFLSRLSKNSFPAKSRELESRVYSVIIPHIDSIRDEELHWFAKYDIPNKLNYYDNLPRRCGKIPPDILLLHKAMTISENHLCNMSKEDLMQYQSADIFNIREIEINPKNVFNKLKTLSKDFDLPLINPITFKRYCLRIIAAKEKKYNSYYSLKDQYLCLEIRKLKDIIRHEKLSKTEIQMKCDKFLNEYCESNTLYIPY